MSLRLAIIFATMTGNAEILAGRACDRAIASGWNATLRNVRDCTVETLREFDVVIYVGSTWGDGEPPDDALDFSNALFADSAPALTELKFAVLSLGDRAYEDFCGHGRRVDERLAALGATRLLERFDADLDYDATYEAWEARAFSVLAALHPAPVAPTLP